MPVGRQAGSRHTVAAMQRRLTALTVLALTASLAACTSDPEPVASSASTAPTAGASASATPTPARDVAVSGADARLTALVEKVYAGRTGIVATATTGTWKGEKVAVVTAGKDVTLAVGPSWKVVGGWWPSLGRPTPQVGKGPRFVLVIGSDARPDQKLEGTRADTLQVVGIDGKGGGGVMGIARDVWAPMPGGGKAKINAAYALGGGQGQVRTVRAVTGLPVSGFVATGFKGFKAIVDDSGGIPITVPRTVTQGRTTVRAGERVLSGKQALAYARERKSLPDGDFGRSRHQGALLLAAAVKARLAGVGILPRELSSVSRNASSDLSAAEALTFVAAFYRLDPRKVGHTVAKGSIGTSSDGQSIVLLDAAARRAFAGFRDGRL